METMEAERPLSITLLNCTVLSNFALAGRLDLLRQGLAGQAATTRAVLAEFAAGARLGYYPDNPLKWLSVLEMSAEEQHTYKELNRHLGAGEASCLAIALHRRLRVATDDLDARHYAQVAQIPVSGTLGILIDLIEQGLFSVEEADSILQAMIRHGYRSPVESLTSLI